ncbi:MAG: hypothetical protein BMS9Abin26_0352 [Gammaproteobacteria bacterium]|nr:MAG: hypothetical protein BMS9Abin26_0352 [Gammaproteobacteria bacterium]
MKNSLVILVISVFVVLGVAFVRIAFTNSDYEEHLAQFDIYLTDYTGYSAGKVRKEPDHRRGKMVTVDIKNNTLDGFTFMRLSDAVRADKPADVGTVVQIKYEWDLFGQYQHEDTGKVTGNAYKSKATVTLFDTITGKAIGRKLFIGPDPDKSQRRDGDLQSRRPFYEIIEFLDQLPEK